MACAEYFVTVSGLPDRQFLPGQKAGEVGEKGTYVQEKDKITM